VSPTMLVSILPSFALIPRNSATMSSNRLIRMRNIDQNHKQATKKTISHRASQLVGLI
jgi:hypothetical protein